MEALTSEAVFLHEFRRQVAEDDRETRVTVYTPGGLQIGIPGVGEGDERLTFPQRYLVGDALKTGQWIQKATPEEIEETPAGFSIQWWRPFDAFTPLSIIHEGGSVALPDDCIGSRGSECLNSVKSVNR